jgi:CheY-like chemotaxis protein
MERHKILIVDDDADWLDVCREMLSRLPSKPEIRTVGAGTRAIARLDAEPFRLLICDLKMPKMDGLQVLSLVRRRFPDLRTVVLTGLEDEEFRSRAYSLGVDLFWLKPDTHQNMQMFLECLESLLGRDAESGFRGIQNKSLMDILQMECLSQSSTVFRITRGSLVGKIWILNGDLIDAETEGARGEVAFRRILEWKSGTFETLPSEPERERTVFKSINALLLETAQAMDEIGNSNQGESREEADHRKTVWRLSSLTREGGEWVVSLSNQGPGAAEGWGTQSANEFSGWMRYATEAVQRLGEKIEAGPWSHIKAQNLERKLVLLPSKNKTFLVAWPPAADSAGIFEQSKKLVSSWDS